MWSIRPKNVQVGFKTLDLIDDFFFYEKMLSSNENVIVFMKNYPDKSSFMFMCLLPISVNKLYFC